MIKVKLMWRLFLVLFFLYPAVVVAEYYILGDSDTAIGMIHFDKLEVDDTTANLSIHFSKLPHRVDFDWCTTRFDISAVCSVFVEINLVKNEPGKPMVFSVEGTFKKQFLKEFSGIQIPEANIEMPGIKTEGFFLFLEAAHYLRPKLKAKLAPEMFGLSLLADSVLKNGKEPNASVVIYK